MQRDFLTGQVDGGQIFCGHPPAIAHVQVTAAKELFDLRLGLLKEALIEEGIGVADCLHWLEADLKFKPVIIRKREDCIPLIAAQGNLDFEDRAPPVPERKAT